MTFEFTYLAVHVLFVVPPIVVLGWLATYRDDVWWDRRAFSGLAIIVALAVGYTTPWDNLLIAEGVWWYGDGTVVATIWYAPLEEYLFFVLQPILTAFWLFHVARIPGRSLRVPWTYRALGAVAGVAASGFGWYLLGTTSTFYLGAVLLWAGPILAIQWAFGGTALWAVRRTLLIAIAVPTLYLWIVDRIAIGLGVWVISDTHTTGRAILGLPIEEALFFLVTNVFIVQGLILYVWVLDRLNGHPTLEEARQRFVDRTDGG